MFKGVVFDWTSVPDVPNLCRQPGGLLAVSDESYFTLSFMTRSTQFPDACAVLTRGVIVPEAVIAVGRDVTLTREYVQMDVSQGEVWRLYVYTVLRHATTYRRKRTLDRRG